MPGPHARAPSRRNGSLVQRADRMHGVEMPHHQDARHVRRGMRKGRAYAVAEAHAPGDALDTRAGDHQFARGDVHHAVHRRRVVGRAFALDPRAQPVQHRIGVERQFGRVHVTVSLGSDSEDLKCGVRRQRINRAEGARWPRRAGRRRARRAWWHCRGVAQVWQTPPRVGRVCGHGGTATTKSPARSQPTNRRNRITPPPSASTKYVILVAMRTAPVYPRLRTMPS